VATEISMRHKPESTQTAGQAEGQIDGQNLTIKIEQAKKRLSPKQRAWMVGGMVVAAAVGYLYFNNKSSNEQAFATHAEIVKIIPKPIDIRAEVIGCIADHVKKLPHNPIPHVVNDVLEAIPGVKVVEHKVASSETPTAYFTGPNGTGCGEVDTYIGSKATGVTVNAEAGGKQVVNIPAKDIVLISKINEANADVIFNDGTMYDLGVAQWNATPLNHIKQEFRQDAGALSAATRATAVNIMQDNCDQVAWSDTELAMTAAYREIAKSEYQTEKAAGVNLQPFVASNITVDVTGGSPSFPPEYTFNKNDNYQFYNSIGACTIDRHALQLGPNQ